MSSNIFCLWRQVKSRFSHLWEKILLLKVKNMIFALNNPNMSLNKQKLGLFKAIELKVIVENQKATNSSTFFLKNIFRKKCKN